MPSGRRSGHCIGCLKLILSLGLTCLVLYLVYRPITPRYYITTFSLFTNATTQTNVSVASFNLQTENKNRQRGIYHNNLAVTLSFGPNHNVVGGDAAIIPSFYQGRHKTANKQGSIAGGGASSWAAAAVTNGSAVFRVAVESAYLYKVLPWNWKSSHQAVSVAGEFAVDAEGKKTAVKGIRLSSSAPTFAWPVPLGPAVACWVLLME